MKNYQRIDRFIESAIYKFAEWLTAFTDQNSKAFGYAVTVDFRDSLREVHFTRFKNGNSKVNRRLIEQAIANKPWDATGDKTAS